MHTSVSVQANNFNLSDELALLNQYSQYCGAIVNFIGQVRGHIIDDKQLIHLFITHLPKATEHEISRIIQIAGEKWSLSYVKVIHRIGHLAVGDQIVLVLTASAHRHDAYEANRYIMDYLKTKAPFWKKECFSNGEEHWVDMKNSDLERLNTWL